MNILKRLKALKNHILERFKLPSKIHFAACTTLLIRLTFQFEPEFHPEYEIRQTKTVSGSVFACQMSLQFHTLTLSLTLSVRFHPQV